MAPLLRATATRLWPHFVVKGIPRPVPLTLPELPCCIQVGCLRRVQSIAATLPKPLIVKTATGGLHAPRTPRGIFGAGEGVACI